VSYFSYYFQVTGINKNERTVVHGQILQRYDGSLCTKTVDEGDRKFIVVSTNKNIDGWHFMNMFYSLTNVKAY